MSREECLNKKEDDGDNYIWRNLILFISAIRYKDDKMDWGYGTSGKIRENNILVEIEITLELQDRYEDTLI